MSVLAAEVTNELILDAVANRKSFSIVRMSDGADGMLTYCKKHAPQEIAWVYDAGWRNRFGVDGITCSEIKKRLDFAQRECTYFAPDGSVDFMRRHYPLRDLQVHVSYMEHSSPEWKISVFKAAGRVLIINRNPEIGSAFKRLVPSVEFVQLYLQNWRESERIRDEAEKIEAPLVLLSGGEGSRYLAPTLAKNRVVLDAGTHLDGILEPSRYPKSWNIQEMR